VSIPQNCGLLVLRVCKWVRGASVKVLGWHWWDGCGGNPKRRSLQHRKQARWATHFGWIISSALALAIAFGTPFLPRRASQTPVWCGLLHWHNRYHQYYRHTWHTIPWRRSTTWPDPVLHPHCRGCRPPRRHRIRVSRPGDCFARRRDRRFGLADDCQFLFQLSL